MEERIKLAILLLLFGLANGESTYNMCRNCTTGGRVWCPQQRTCVAQELDCNITNLNAVKWFKGVGSCLSPPVLLPFLCPELEVEFDPRVGNVMYGNMISVPIQPRILIYDFSTDVEYSIGGYFSYTPPNSHQRPEFFFFTQSVDKFVHFNYQPYHSVPPDDFSSNASQIVQFLDLTVVGNINLLYEVVFVVARNSSAQASACAFTPPISFQQQPTYRDFSFTLLAIGLVVWVVGTLILVNCMIYFNHCEKMQMAKEKTSAAAANEPKYSGIGGFRGYLRNLLLEASVFLKSLSLSDKNLLTEYGVTLYHYIWFHRMALIYIGACTLIAMSMALPTDLMGGSNRDIIAGDFATSTIASLALNSKINLVHFFIIVINISFSIVFVWTLRKRSFAVIVAEEQEVLPTREFAVEIHGMSRKICDEQILLDHFNHIYGHDKVLSVHIPLVYGNAWKLQALKEKKEKYENIFRHTNDRPLIFSRIWHIFRARYKVDAIHYYEEKINQLLPKLKLTGPNQASGYAYVTFRDRNTVTTCLKNNNHSTRWYWYLKITGFVSKNRASIAPKENPHFSAPYAEDLNCKNWAVHPAPLPHEINWKNLEFSHRKKRFLSFFILFVEIVVLTSVLSVTAGFAVVEVARDLYLTDIYYRLGGATFLETIATIGVAILPEAVAIIEEAVAPIVESLEDKAGHIHKSGWRKTVMWHTAFFELMSGLVISRMVYFLIGVAVLYKADSPLDSYHYIFNKTGMDMMKYVCIKTFTVYGIKYPVLCLFKLIEARWTGEFERPEFDYYDLYAQKIIVMFCVVVYGSVMPLILPLGVIYLGVSFLYDRWAIVAFHKKDTLHDSKLLFYAADICSFYFAIAPLATLLIISKLFVFWPVLAGILIVFSILVGIVMLETRRWQYMNQHLKGVHTIIKVSDHTFAKHISSSSLLDPLLQNTNPKGARNSKPWDSFTTQTKHVLMGVMKGMQEGVQPEEIANAHETTTQEDILSSAYVHPFNRP